MADKTMGTFGFLCQKFSGTPKVMESEEITDWRRFPLGELPEKVFPPSKKVLDHHFKNEIY